MMSFPAPRVSGLSSLSVLSFLLLRLIFSTMALKHHHAYLALFSSPGFEDSDIPWYSSSYESSVLEASRYEEFPPIIFSPRGRLHKVEAAVKASKLVTPRSNIVIALKCREGLLVVTTVPTSAFLNTSEILQGVATNGDNTDQHDESHGESGRGDIHHSSDYDDARNHSLWSTSSLFLFDETCQTTTTSPIMLDGPLVQHDIVAATGGNAVDGIILRFNFLSLVTRAVQTVSGVESVASNIDSDDAVSEVLLARDLAHDMANMFQVGSQDLRKAKIRLLASSLVVLGQGEIWRVDPTGQFWNCHATVIGQDSDSIEEALFQTLMERSTKVDGDTSKKISSYANPKIQKVLETLPFSEALDLVRGCLESHFLSHIKKEGFLGDDSLTRSPSTTKAIAQVFWHAVLLDYSTGGASVKEKLQSIRGMGQKARRRASKVVKRGSILLGGL
jgi:20S proteasome alpha/beta subunit